MIFSTAKRCSHNHTEIPSQSKPNPLIALKQENPEKTHDVIYFLKRKSYKDLKNNVPKSVTPKYTNTNTKIHKYTNMTSTRVRGIVTRQRQRSETARLAMKTFLDSTLI